jgi:hypothetical protein
MSYPGYPVYPPPRPARTSVATHLWVAAGIGLLFGLILFMVRAPVNRSVGGGFVMALVGFGLLRAMEGGPVEWPHPPLGHVGRSAAAQRWRLGGFDSMVDRMPNLSPHLRLRLRALAQAILTRRGLEPGTPAAVSLLGAEAHEILFPTPRDPGDPRPDDPSAAALHALVDRLLLLSAPHDRSMNGFPGSPAPVVSPEALSKGNR